MRALARSYAGKVHALGITDNRDGACMSALAAASIAASEGVEPVIHMVTRDRNRIALISDCLGAMALGIGNILCTTGTHQTLGPCRAAKNVFDVDSIQLIQALAALGTDGSIVGEDAFDVPSALCLGATASPQADPLELQVMRTAKKVAAGARFLVTQPVFDIERFDAWWNEVARRGIHEKAAIIAGIEPLTDVEDARAYAAKRPSPMVPDAVIERIASGTDKDAQHAEGVSIALETIERLSSIDGLRGFEFRGDAALEVIEKSGLGDD